MCHCVRWAVRISSLNFGKEDWIRAFASIQPDEREKVQKFVFKNEAISKLIGRLLIRNYCQIHSSTPWTELKLLRDSNDKPFMESSQMLKGPFSFNISHAGEFVILAGSCTKSVGCDVMPIHQSHNSYTWSGYINLMKRQFSQREFQSMQKISEMESKKKFIRYWCLKESFVKVLGTGIDHLGRLDFHLNSPNGTELFIDDQLQNEWNFEEYEIDSKHLAAVCFPKENLQFCDFRRPQNFQEFQLDQLLSDAKPLLPPVVGDLEWEKFNRKELRSWIRN